MNLDPDVEMEFENLDGLQIAMYLHNRPGSTFQVIKPEDYVFKGHVTVKTVPEKLGIDYDECIALTLLDGKEIHFCRSGWGFWVSLTQDPVTEEWCVSDKNSLYDHDVIS